MFLSAVLMLLACSLQAENVTLKAGTMVPLKAQSTVYAKQVEIGDQVKFTVIADIKADGKVVIPVGTVAYGKVTEAKKSSLAGTKGRLSINMDYLLLGTGERVYLSGGEVRITGKNRTALSVALTVLCVWPCIFIPGTKAVMPAGYEVDASIANNVEITL